MVGALPPQSLQMKPSMITIKGKDCAPVCVWIDVPEGRYKGNGRNRPQTRVLLCKAGNDGLLVYGVGRGF